MADKSFGIKELNLIGSGTPKMESPNNINLNANNVAISTNATIGGNLDITGNLTVNGTSPTGGLTVQDEGSALSTTASTLNFVGTGVVASGTGATKTITINTGSASTEVYIAESADSNAGYNIPFMNVTGAGGGQKGLQVDNASFGFNPSTHTLFVNNLSSLSSADFLITAMGETCRGIGYFKFTASSNSASALLLGNVAIGYSAGSQSANPATSSNNMRNVFVGSLAGLNQTSGQFNTYVGFSAGSTNLFGDQNVAVGFNAGDGNLSGSNNTYLGTGAAATSSSTSNEVVIGNSNVSKFKIPGINFTLKDNGGTPTTGHVLTVDSSGEASFEIIPQEDGITSTSTISNLSSASDVMVGLSMGNRIHLEDDGSNANIEISTGETRNAGNIVIKTGRLNSGSSVYLLANGNNSSNGASIKIAHTTGKVLVGSQLGNYNIGGTSGSNEYNGFLFNLDGTMETCSATGSSLINIKMKRRDTGKVFSFQKSGGTEVGSISLNVSENITVYAGTSDYRIKENDVKITNSITRLNQLRPIRFNFKENTSKTLDGFFAHEVQTVVPEAVIGTKDEVDSNNEPVLQGIDQSKLVPLLTAALQDAITEIENLKTRVAALEGS